MRDKLYEILRWTAVGLVLVLLLVMSLQGRASTTEFPVVEQAVAAELDLTGMQKADNQMLRRLYGLQPSDFAGCTLYYPTSNMGAQELLLVKLSDASQQQAVLDAIASRLETQKASFDGYGVEQYDLLTNHCVIEARSGYVLFVVHPDAENVKAAFLSSL